MEEFPVPNVKSSVKQRHSEECAIGNPCSESLPPFHLTPKHQKGTMFCEYFSSVSSRVILFFKTSLIIVGPIFLLSVCRSTVYLEATAKYSSIIKLSRACANIASTTHSSCPHGSREGPSHTSTSRELPFYHSLLLPFFHPSIPGG